VGQVTVFSGPARRRRWSDEERLQILGEAFAPGALVAQVAQRDVVSTGLIYTWRRNFRRRAAASDAPAVVSGFIEAVVADESPVELPAGHAAIVVELSGGKKVSIGSHRLRWPRRH
jgi:transposase